MTASAVATAAAWSANVCMGENIEQAAKAPMPASSEAINSNAPAGNSISCLLPTGPKTYVDCAPGTISRFMHQGVSSIPSQS